MAALTLAQVFGANASLSAGVLTVNLADLVATGLTDTSTSPSEILTAIVLNVKNNQSATAADDTEVGVVVGDPYRMISRSDTQLETQYPLSIYTPLNISALDPDDVVG